MSSTNVFCAPSCRVLRCASKLWQKTWAHVIVLAVLGLSDARQGVQGGDISVGIGNDGVVHNAAGGVCLNVLNPPVHWEIASAWLYV